MWPDLSEELAAYVVANADSLPGSLDALVEDQNWRQLFQHYLWQDSPRAVLNAHFLFDFLVDHLNLNGPSTDVVDRYKDTVQPNLRDFPDNVQAELRLVFEGNQPDSTLPVYRAFLLEKLAPWFTAFRQEVQNMVAWRASEARYVETSRAFRANGVERDPNLAALQAPMSLEELKSDRVGRYLVEVSEHNLKHAAPGTVLDFVAHDDGPLLLIGPGFPAHYVNSVTLQGGWAGQIRVQSRGSGLSAGTVEVLVPDGYQDSVRRALRRFSKKRVEFVRAFG